MDDNEIQYSAVRRALNNADHSSAALGLRLHLEHVLDNDENGIEDRVEALMEELIAFKAFHLTAKKDNDW
jgi:hypothetical protein